MKNYGLIAALCVPLCLTGCFSVDSAKIQVGGGEHVVMRNYGWKFFNWVPLFSGNASEDAISGCALFRDDVTMEKMQPRFESYANGRTIEDMTYDVNNSPFIYVLAIPIPYLFTYKEMSISGVMK